MKETVYSDLHENQIFVFGSNREGRHGTGAAKLAFNHFGAKYGQASGLQGQSYAIVTKELRPSAPSVTLEEVKRGVDTFLEFAKANPDKEFLVTRLGCGLAGFKDREIAELFADAPKNCSLPNKWTYILKQKNFAPLSKAAIEENYLQHGVILWD